MSLTRTAPKPAAPHPFPRPRLPEERGLLRAHILEERLLLRREPLQTRHARLDVLEEMVLQGPVKQTQARPSQEIRFLGPDKLILGEHRNVADALFGISGGKTDSTGIPFLVEFTRGTLPPKTKKTGRHWASGTWNPLFLFGGRPPWKGFMDIFVRKL